MKNLLSFAFLLIPIFIWSQNTNHFANSNSKWNVATSYPNANEDNPTFVETRTSIYGFEGDTTINEQVWLRMFSTTDDTFSSELNFESFILASEQFVLSMKYNGLVDTLYRFDLNVGDSSLFHFQEETFYLYVSQIDSILIQDQYFKTFKFSEPTGFNDFSFVNELWIEGIGSKHGPLFPFNAKRFATELPDSSLLTCSHINDEQYWDHPNYSDCMVNIILGIKDQEQLTGLKVYPNPFENRINIELDKSQNLAIEILNIHGELMISKTSNSINTTIDLEAIPTGIYFISLQSKDSKVVKKILKN